MSRRGIFLMILSWMLFLSISGLAGFTTGWIQTVGQTLLGVWALLLMIATRFGMVGDVVRWSWHRLRPEKSEGEITPR